MLKLKQEKLLTTGEFAKLSQSTKRTVHWYTKLGLLKPKKINSKGYRFYSIEQIIDLQVIMLLRNLNFSLSEIKSFLRKNASTQDLFFEKKKSLLENISKLQKQLDDISGFYQNLKTEGTLIKPIIKIVPSLKAYLIERSGPYSEIYNYCFELKSYFSTLPKDATYFVLFPEREYSPKKDQLKIGIIATKDMILKEQFQKNVQLTVIPSFKAFNYKHIGSPALISMLIMQMHKYMDKNDIKQDLNIPINELEFYSNSKLNGNDDENSMVSDINIPVLD